MSIDIVQTSWNDYKYFVHLCEVDTMPLKTGPCWIIRPDIAFIGYQYPYINNRQRNCAFPHLQGIHRLDYALWINTQLYSLSRVMVHPNHRGQGLAQKIVKFSLDHVDRKYLECLTTNQAILHVLQNCGFKLRLSLKEEKCFYLVWP